MLVKCYASALNGIGATTVTIEVDISQGINFFLVGLPDSAVKESQRRIESALRSSGFDIPKKRIVINMAPADVRKEGSAYDLPLAVGMLAASALIPPDGLSEYLIMGELSLDGKLKRIKGALSMAIHARKDGFRGIILPSENSPEASVIGGINVLGMRDLREVVLFLAEGAIPDRNENLDGLDIRAPNDRDSDFRPDFSDVKGQAAVKRAMEVAAAGGHNLLMVGPPGSGKTMLAKRLPSILPPLTDEESIETTSIHSVAGKLGPGESLVRYRPFRDPHHTISDIAMVGGGANPQPGEISLAHNGVLFMDELPEFKRNVLEVLRQPMEGRVMRISRAKISTEYPASFMLVASMNPCPCGYYNHPDRECECSPGEANKYLSRISGPLLDRFDIQIEVTPVPFQDLNQGSNSSDPESSSLVQQRVAAARKIQEERYSAYSGISNNAQINSSMMKRYCNPEPAGSALLKNAMEKLDLSARAYDRILKVARTIADLSKSDGVQTQHLAEAINYRSLDRKGWGG